MPAVAARREAIAAYARGWSAQHRRLRQHKGPITRAFLEVLQALLWGSTTAAPGRATR